MTQSPQPQEQDLPQPMNYAELFAAAYKDWWLDRTAENGAAFTSAKAALQQSIADQLRAAIAQERERCVEICKAHAEEWKRKVLLGYVAVLDDAARAIREGKKP